MPGHSNNHFTISTSHLPQCTGLIFLSVSINWTSRDAGAGRDRNKTKLWLAIKPGTNKPPPLPPRLCKCHRLRCLDTWTNRDLQPGDIGNGASWSLHTPSSLTLWQKDWQKGFKYGKYKVLQSNSYSPYYFLHFVQCPKHLGQTIR